MKITTTRGMYSNGKGIWLSDITIRTERTGDYVSVSLADEKRGVLMQVSYRDIEKLVKETKNQADEL